MGPWWSLEVLGEVGLLAPSSSFQTVNGQGRDSNVSFVRESLVPMLRLHTIGRWRLTAASGVGLTVEQVRANLDEGSQVWRRTGTGAGVAWVTEVGGEVDLGKAFLEASAFLEVHGLGTPTDEATQARFFEERSATRGGVRFLVGWRL
jgi:hypothetical protein